MNKSVILAAVVAASVGAPAAVLAQQAGGIKPEDGVKMRQGLMQLQKVNRGAINQVVKGEAALDASTVAAADNLVALATMLPQAFPAGSGRDVIETSRALPKIWEEPAAFEERYAELQREAARLAEVARGGNVEALTSQLEAVAGACNNCHDNFRFDEKKAQ